MKPEIKIEDLRILQEVYLDGEKVVIDSLSTSLYSGESVISFTSRAGKYSLKDLQDHLSLTPPKKTKRYWQWKVRDGSWHRPTTYIDDNGCNTSGDKEWEFWDSRKKQKIEDDFIDIEVSE